MYKIPEIDLKANSFIADFYIWFTWRGDIDPTRSFEFMNAIARSEITQIPVYTSDSGADKPIVLPDGQLHQEYHVQARFGQPFPLNRYPLDEQDITIEVEDISNLARDLVHVIDIAQSKVHPSLAVPGWNIQPLRGESSIAKYDTNFGNTQAEVSEYSNVRFIMHVTRPALSVLGKTILPLVLVLFITFTAFFIDPQYVDARSALTVTALISAVALQFAAISELPPTGYLTLLDKVYILCYALILLATMVVTINHRLATSERTAQALRVDRAALISLTVLLLGGIGFLLYFP